MSRQADGRQPPLARANHLERAAADASGGSEHGDVGDRLCHESERETISMPWAALSPRLRRRENERWIWPNKTRAEKKRCGVRNRKIGISGTTRHRSPELPFFPAASLKIRNRRHAGHCLRTAEAAHCPGSLASNPAPVGASAPSPVILKLPSGAHNPNATARASTQTTAREPRKRLPRRSLTCGQFQSYD